MVLAALASFKKSLMMRLQITWRSASRRKARVGLQNIDCGDANPGWMSKSAYCEGRQRTKDAQASLS
jgi:hypothetical protein